MTIAEEFIEQRKAEMIAFFEVIRPLSDIEKSAYELAFMHGMAAANEYHAKLQKVFRG